MQAIGPAWERWTWSAGALVLSLALALIGHALLYRVLRRVARRSVNVVDDALVRRRDRPCRAAPRPG